MEPLYGALAWSPCMEPLHEKFCMETLHTEPLQMVTTFMVPTFMVPTFMVPTFMWMNKKISTFLNPTNFFHRSEKNKKHSLPLKYIMKLSFSLFIALASSTVDYAYGHGYLSSPRSRVFYAHQEGVEGSVAGVPKREWFHRSILRKAANQVCGTTPTQNYDDYRDSTGRPMPWIPQGVYSEGQEIDIEVHLTQSHWGHIELYACPDGNASTQECLIRNPLTMVKDLTYGGPRDSTYPQRGYVGIPEGGNGTLRFRYRLPRGVKGNQVMLQWRYVTANSCLPPGYVSTCSALLFSKYSI